MAEYCTAAQVEKRLKSAGYLNVADDDDDGTVSTGELASNITTGIEWAGGKIDYYVSNRAPAYVPATLRAGPNSWCSQRAVDLAAWHAATNGGRDCPESIQTAKDEAMDELKEIANDGNTIPGANISTSYNLSDHTPFEFLSIGR